MKEIKHLDRVQAVLPVYSTLILATIQELDLKSEPACNYQFHNTIQIDFKF